MLIVGGTMMLVPQPMWDAIGIALAIAVIAMQKLRRGDELVGGRR